MPRKSLKIRLSQTQELLKNYEDAGLCSDRSYRFMSDMVVRMDIGKGMSKGQRTYLDNLIDQGVPTPKNEKQVSEILAASEVDGMQKVSSTLKDFAYKIGKGWKLSEKQEKFLESLLKKSEELKVTGRFRPSAESIKDLNIAIEVCNKKNDWYWQHRPGTAKAYDVVRSWMLWNDRREALEVACGTEKELMPILGPEPIIDSWACEKIVKACKNPIDEMKNPKHPAGMMRWLSQGPGPSKLLLIAGDPELHRGLVVYPCLVNGESKMISTEHIKKRRG